MPDYEGDDILGSAAKQFTANSNETQAFILSGDKDLFQLIDDKINVIIPPFFTYLYSIR